jgi:hypothetical protein
MVRACTRQLAAYRGPQQRPVTRARLASESSRNRDSEAGIDRSQASVRHDAQSASVTAAAWAS